MTELITRMLSQHSEQSKFDDFEILDEMDLSVEGAGECGPKSCGVTCRDTCKVTN